MPIAALAALQQPSAASCVLFAFAALAAPHCISHALVIVVFFAPTAAHALHVPVLQRLLGLSAALAALHWSSPASAFAVCLFAALAASFCVLQALSGRLCGLSVHVYVFAAFCCPAAALSCLPLHLHLARLVHRSLLVVCLSLIHI